VTGVTDFQQWLESRGMSEATVRNYLSDLRELEGWCNPVTLDSSDATTFDQLSTGYLNSIRKTLAPKTVQRRMTAFRTYARSLDWKCPALAEYRAPTPARPVPHPLPEGVDGVTRMIVAAANERQKALIGLCGLAGLRCTEARLLPLDHIDWTETTLKVVGKGDKTRIVPMTTTLVAVIAARVGQAALAGDNVLVGLSDRQARDAITVAARRAGLARHVSSHDLRATFATAAYNKSLNLRAVQELLGHASSTTTEVYTAVDINHLREAASIT
jgi:site-specific recombinase XerC